MTLFGYKRTPWRVGQHVCFSPRSSHPNTDVGFSKKNVGFSLNSRRNRGIGFSSAPDPNQSSGQLVVLTDGCHMFPGASLSDTSCAVFDIGLIGKQGFGPADSPGNMASI
jgi:hypothetical protein